MRSPTRYNTSKTPPHGTPNRPIVKWNALPNTSKDLQNTFTRHPKPTSCKAECGLQHVEQNKKTPDCYSSFYCGLRTQMAHMAHDTHGPTDNRTHTHRRKCPMPERNSTGKWVGTGCDGTVAAIVAAHAAVSETAHTPTLRYRSTFRSRLS